jgi:ATP-binding cassette subfamily B protein
MFFSAALMVCETLSSLGILHQLRRLFDELAAAKEMTAGAQSFLPRIAMTFACMLALMVSRSWSALARESQALLVTDSISGQVQRQALAADLAFFESPRYADTLERARKAGSLRVARVTGNILAAVRNALMIGAFMVMVGTISWSLVPVLVVALLPALLVHVRFARKLHDWRLNRTRLEREGAYVDALMTSEMHARELRMYNLGEHLGSLYEAIRGRIRGEQLNLGIRRISFESAAGGLSILILFATVAVLAGRTAAGQHSIGQLLLFLLVVQRLQSTGQDFVQQLGGLYEDSLHLRLIFDFLDVRPDLPRAAHPRLLPGRLRHGISMENVGFRYPGSEVQVLTGINLNLPTGCLVGLVGANGSGKSTLIKLLCRLYDPTEGRITLDGVDIRQFALEDYRRQLSVIFQDYRRYDFTARENIWFADVRLPSDSPRIIEAARSSGADGFIRRFHSGYETRLGRMYEDGHEASDGQWQRIAMARAFLPDSRFVVLDEPTSSLDPNAEYEVLRDFRRSIGERGALLISHRLSAVRHADRIYVLEAGHLREAGTHEELMAEHGHYHVLFEQQARYYR